VTDAFKRAYLRLALSQQTRYKVCTYSVRARKFLQMGYLAFSAFMRFSPFSCSSSIPSDVTQALAVR
jgi:hypothetical protein